VQIKSESNKIKVGWKKGRDMSFDSSRRAESTVPFANLGIDSGPSYIAYSNFSPQDRPYSPLWSFNISDL